MQAFFMTPGVYAPVIGIFTVLGIAFLCSHDRKKISIKLVCNALLLLCVMAAAILANSIGQSILQSLANGVASLYAAALEGIQFVFGPLALVQEPWGFIFAIRALPVVIFFGALMNALLHFGIIQRVVSLLNLVVQPILGTSGAETLCAIANSFLGQTEAPLLIRHRLATLTRSELFVVMVSGMGTISAALLAVYGGMGVPIRHLLCSSVLSIPATLLIAKIMYPETEHEKQDAAQAEETPRARNVLDAITSGAIDAAYMAFHVGAVLIAFIALIGMINSIFGYFCTTLSFPCWTLQDIFGVIFMPFGWLLGMRGDELIIAGKLLGTKVVINELVAYRVLVEAGLSERSVAVMTYALCGFSNFCSIGIQIGGIGALAPSQRPALSALGLRAVCGGMLANILSACVASLFL